MKTACWLCFFLFLLNSTINAQEEITPFRLLDTHAKKIDAAVLLQLQADDWYCYDRRMRYDGLYSKTHPGYQMVFKADGTLILARYGSVEKLRWKIVENKLLQIYSETADPYPADKILGAYAIYKISSEELIMAKSLTSNFDYKQILYFYHADRYFALTEVQEKPRVSRGYAKTFEQVATQAKKAVSINELDLNDVGQLRERVKMKMFMRGQKPPADFPDWDVQQLRDYFKQWIINW